MAILVSQYAEEAFALYYRFYSKELTLSHMGDTSYSSKEIILSFFKFVKSMNFSPFLLISSAHHIFLHLQKVKDVHLSFRWDNESLMLFLLSLPSPHPSPPLWLWCRFCCNILVLYLHYLIFRHRLEEHTIVIVLDCQNLK